MSPLQDPPDGRCAGSSSSCPGRWRRPGWHWLPESMKSSVISSATATRSLLWPGTSRNRLAASGEAADMGAAQRVQRAAARSVRPRTTEDQARADQRTRPNGPARRWVARPSPAGGHHSSSSAFLPSIGHRHRGGAGTRGDPGLDVFEQSDGQRLQRFRQGFAPSSKHQAGRICMWHTALQRIANLPRRQFGVP